MISHNPIYACRFRTYSCVVKNSIKNIIVINANLLIMLELNCNAMRKREQTRRSRGMFSRENFKFKSSEMVINVSKTDNSIVHL